MNYEKTIDEMLEAMDAANAENRWEKARQIAIEIEAVLDEMRGDEVKVTFH